MSMVTYVHSYTCTCTRFTVIMWYFLKLVFEKIAHNTTIFLTLTAILVNSMNTFRMESNYSWEDISQGACHACMHFLFKT